MQIHIYHILYEFLFATAIMAPFMQLCTGGAGVIRFLMHQLARRMAMQSAGAVVEFWPPEAIFLVFLYNFHYILRSLTTSGASALRHGRLSCGAPDAHGATVRAN